MLFGVPIGRAKFPKISRFVRNNVILLGRLRRVLDRATCVVHLRTHAGLSLQVLRAVTLVDGLPRAPRFEIVVCLLRF